MRTFKATLAIVTLLMGIFSSILLIPHTMAVYGNPLGWSYLAHCLLTAYLWLTLSATAHHVDES